MSWNSVDESPFNGIPATNKSDASSFVAPPWLLESQDQNQQLVQQKQPSVQQNNIENLPAASGPQPERFLSIVFYLLSFLFNLICNLTF